MSGVNESSDILLGPINTLLDLNKTPNFSTEYTITAKNPNDVFFVGVSSGKAIDGEVAVDFGAYKGQASGKAQNDKGGLESYYLVLRSETPVMVTVSMSYSTVEQKTSLSEGKKRSASEEDKKSDFAADEDTKTAKKKYMVGIVVVAILGILAYSYRKWKRSSSETKRSVTSFRSSTRLS